MNFKLKTDTEFNPELLDKLYESIGWTKRGVKKWQEVLSKSSYCVSAWDDDNLIGFGRIVEDGVMCMIYDVAVNPDFQNHGCGKNIMLKLIDQVKDQKYASIGLFAWEDNPDNIPFYQKLGFVISPTGMELTKYMVRE